MSVAAVKSQLAAWSATPTVRSMRKNIEKVDGHLDKAAHMVSGLTGTLMVAHGISGLSGNENPGITNAKNAVGALEDGLYLLRSVFTPVKLALGSLFYKVNEDGSLADKKREWLMTLLEVALFVYRILNPINWLRAIKAIDLGSHAEGVKKATLAFCLTVCSLATIQALKDWWNSATADKVAYHASNVGTCAADSIEVGFCFSSLTSHAASIGIGALKIFGSACYAIRDIVEEIKS